MGSGNADRKTDGHIGERYKQVKVSVAPEIASSFREACAAAHTSMASELARFMAKYSSMATSAGKPSPTYSTRRQRRTAIVTIVKQLCLIREGEERYRDSIPENLQGSMVYDRADELVALLDEAIDLLGQV